MEKGLVKVYCGVGKGKSQSSLGRAVVCASEGKSVFVVQFLKGRTSGQLDYLRKLEPDIKFFRFEKERKYFETLTSEEREEEKINIVNGMHFARKVVSIDEIRAEYPDYATNMKDSMLAVASDGKNYAVPSYGYWENMFVNKSVLDACGIEVPGPDYTWDQFLADCQTILDNGYTPIACSLVEVPHYWFEFVVMNNGSLANHLDVPASMDDAAAAKWVAGLNDIKDLYERGFFPKNTLTATDAETVAMFGEGEAAFLIDGSWKVGYFTGNHEDTLEDYAISYVPGKGDRSASEAIGGISMGYFITRKAWEDPAKREAAVEFVSYLTSDEVLSNFVTTEVTALVNGAKPEGLNLLQQSAADANAAITGIAGAVQDTITSEAKGDLFGNIQNVVTGKMTAEEAVASAIALN